MKLIHFGIVAVMAWAAMVPEQFNNVQGDAQLFNELECSAIVALPSVKHIGFWPDYVGRPGDVWLNGRIPSGVLSDATHWVRTIIAPSILPNDLRARWRGLEGDSTNPDLLGARYRTNDSTIQLVETGKYLEILIIMGSSPELPNENAAQQHIISVLQNFTRFPEDKLGQLTWSSDSSTQGPTRIWHGYAFAQMRGSAEDSYWWSNIAFVTNGRFVALRIQEVVPGTRPTLGSAKTGGQISRRFRNE